MSTRPQVLLTAEGWRRLNDELADLRRRRADARSAILRGETSAQSDSVASPSEIEYLSHCVVELEYVVARAVPVPTDHHERDTVGLGSEVDVCWADTSRETYVIVSPSGAEPGLGRISHSSPVGLALMGRRAGDLVPFVTDERTTQFLVESVR